MAMEKGKFVEVMGSSLKALNKVLTVTTEFEGISANTRSYITRKLGAVGAGLQPRELKHENNGNGFNNDMHRDGTIYYDNFADDVNWYGFEISISPMKQVTFSTIRAELVRLTDMLIKATGGMRHTHHASNHIHVALPYEYDGYRDRVEDNLVEMDFTKINRLIAVFFMKFMPILKYYAMTSANGARGASDNGYDTLNQDALFAWFDNVKRFGHSGDTDRQLNYMQRGSYLRIYRGTTGGTTGVHIENRITDQSASPTHLAVMMTLTRAMVLWAIDFARNGYEFNVNVQEKEHSQNLMEQHKRGYRHLDMASIKELNKEMISYLAKYLKIMDSMECLDYMEKLIACSIPAFLNKEGYGKNYDPSKIEKVFNQRNRTGNEELRNDYLYAIKSMAVRVADSLEDFHQNIAEYLTNKGHDGVELKQAKSLYQMFNREHVDITFLGGRLVYMGE